MSLHKFAEQVAAHGRGDDSLLVHMTPDEVRKLQQFAQANGTTLTINPNTGLPEAGLLSDLFKAVAPIALGAFLGPGAFGIAGLGMSAGMAGAAVGGLTTLATGSLSRGLMAGLGAYGGAGMAEGLAGAGTAELGKQAIASTASELMNAGAGEALTGEAYNTALQQGVTDRLAAATPQSTWSAATQAVSADPMQFAKNNWQSLAAAASPIAADLMTPTTTKMPDLTGNTGYIRQKIYDPYTQTYRSMAPVKASEWGDRNFSDIYKGASGGIVALAGGGSYSTVREDGSFDYDNTFDDGSAAAAATQQAAQQAAQQVATQQADQQGIAALNQPGTSSALTSWGQPLPTVQDKILSFAEQAGPLATATTGGASTAGIADWMDKNNVTAQQYADALASKFGAESPYTASGIQSLYDTASKVADQAAIINAASPVKDVHDTVNDAAWAKWLAENNVALPSAATAFGLAGSEVEQRAAKVAADKAAADKAAADKAALDKAAADKAAADAAAAAAAKAAADKAAADKAAADKAAADKAALDKAAADKAAADKAARDKAAADAAAKLKAEQDAAAAAAAKAKADADATARAAAEKAAADAAARAAADKAARDKAIADAAAAAKAAAEKAAADAAAKALADGKSVAEAAAAAAKAKAEADARAKAAADKAAADAAAAANKITSVGVQNLYTNTGVTQDKTDTTTTGPITLASTTPGGITSNITTDGQYIGTTGTTSPIGTKVGQGTISGVGTEANTGTTGPIIDFGGTAGFTTSPLALAKQQIAEQSAATNAAQNTQLDLYRNWVVQNPNATDLEHANFMDKINLSPDVASRATGLSAQQMKNRYYDAKYNKMTGDSQAAYNFLMGKGAYPTKSGVGEIMRPYSQATLGMPASTNQKYVFNPVTKTYSLNQDYVGSYRDSKGNVNYTMSPAEIAAYFRSNQGQADSTTYDWAVENGLSPEDIASATGVPLSTVAAKWRDAKAKKEAAAKTAADTAAAASKTETMDASSTGGNATGGLMKLAMGGMPMPAYSVGGGLGSLGSYSDGGRLLKGPGDGVSDSIPATIGAKQQPARLADGEFVVPARIVSELGNGSTEAGAKKLYAMMDRVQRARGQTTGKNKVAANTRADKYLPA